jgi:NhaP-type Na+/H+ or K+/H+ antiporter
MTKANKAGGPGVQSFSLLSLTGFSQLFVEFFYLSIISFCIGIGLGFLLSYLYKIMKISRDESALEISLFF